MDHLRGTLDLLVLNALLERAMHGYEIARWLEHTTDATLTIEEGSLYPALHRLARRGWIEGRWGKNEGNRRVKVYRLTPAGVAEHRSATERWNRFVAAVAKVIQPPRTSVSG